MAIRKGILEESRADQIRCRLEEIGHRHELGNKGSEVMASWVLNLDLAVPDLVYAQGGKLAEEFDGMGETEEEVREYSIIDWVTLFYYCRLCLPRDTLKGSQTQNGVNKSYIAKGPNQLSQETYHKE